MSRATMMSSARQCRFSSSCNNNKYNNNHSRYKNECNRYKNKSIACLQLRNSIQRSVRRNDSNDTNPNNSSNTNTTTNDVDVNEFLNNDTIPPNLSTRSVNVNSDSDNFSNIDYSTPSEDNDFDLSSPDSMVSWMKSGVQAAIKVQKNLDEHKKELLLNFRIIIN